MAEAVSAVFINFFSFLLPVFLSQSWCRSPRAGTAFTEVVPLSQRGTAFLEKFSHPREFDGAVEGQSTVMKCSRKIAKPCWSGRMSHFVGTSCRIANKLWFSDKRFRQKVATRGSFETVSERPVLTYLGSHLPRPERRVPLARPKAESRDGFGTLRPRLGR